MAEAEVAGPHPACCAATAAGDAGAAGGCAAGGAPTAICLGSGGGTCRADKGARARRRGWGDDVYIAAGVAMGAGRISWREGLGAGGEAGGGAYISAGGGWTHRADKGG